MIDFSEMLHQMQAGSLQPTHGVSIKSISRNDLMSSLSKGWKEIFGSGNLSQLFIERYMNGFFSVLAFRRGYVRRGAVGNQGDTTLTVFDLSSPRYSSVVDMIPRPWLRPVLNTTKEMPRSLSSDTAPQMSFLPPPSAYQAGTSDHRTLRSIIQEYQSVHVPTSARQARRTHTEDEIISGLKASQRDSGSGWVLIQRASRTKGEVCLLEQEGILLSTNVPMIKLPTNRERELFASWMLSVFGQIQLEILGTSQEGMRKLEMSSIKGLLYPDFSSISAGIESVLRSNLMTEPALSFSQIEQRPSDKLWAEVIAPNDVEACLNQAFELFQQLVDQRRGFGS